MRLEVAIFMRCVMGFWVAICAIACGEFVAARFSTASGRGAHLGVLFRAPARRGVTFFSGKKETHERKLPWSGDDPERSHGLASLALGSLIWVLVVMPLAGWFYRSFANSFKPCMFARPLRLPCGCLDGSPLSSCCSLARYAGEGWGEGVPAPEPAPGCPRPGWE